MNTSPTPNPSNVIAKGIIKAVIFLAALVLAWWVLEKLYPVIVYLILAWILSLLGQPMQEFLQNRLKFRPSLATLSVLFLFLLLALLFIGLFVPLVLKQSENLSMLQTDAFREKLQESLEIFQNYLKSKHIDIGDRIDLWSWIQRIDLGFVTHFIRFLAGFLGDLFIGLFSVLFISFFMLGQPGLVSGFIARMLPRHDLEQFHRVRLRIKKLMRNYVGGLMMQIGILFVIYTLSLLLIGVPDAVIIALIGALLNLIPYIGPLISLLLMLTLSITSQLGNGHPFDAIPWILLMFAVAQLIDNFFSQPFIYSRSVQSHPLEIFLVILVSGYLFGILGMVIAVPAYTILKILLGEFYTEYKDRYFSW